MYSAVCKKFLTIVLEDDATEISGKMTEEDMIQVTFNLH